MADAHHKQVLVVVVSPPHTPLLIGLVMNSGYQSWTWMVSAVPSFVALPPPDDATVYRVHAHFALIRLLQSFFMLFDVVSDLDHVILKQIFMIFVSKLHVTLDVLIV